MASNEVDDKLRLVLLQFLNVNFKLCDDTCFEKLLTHLGNQEGVENLRSVCLNWFEQFLHSGSSDPSITSFAVRLVSLFTRTAEGFQELQSTNVVERLCNLLRKETEVLANDPSTKQAYILLLSSLSEHRMGRNLIIEHAWWEDVVKLYDEGKSIYIKRDGQKFITKLLTELEENPLVCEEILRQVLRPLVEVRRENILMLKDETHLLPMLRLASHIFETCLSAEKFTVSEIVLGKFDLESKIWALFSETTNSSILTENAARLLTLMYFVSFKKEKGDKIKRNEIAETDLEDLEKKVFGLVGLLIPRKDVDNIMKITVYCHLTWKKMFPAMVNSGPSNHLFENQLITVQLMPLITSVESRTSENECLDMYCQKLFSLTSVDTQRMCYSFRAAMLEMPELLVIARTSILDIMRLEQVMHRDRAVIVFQALMYKFKDFVAPPHESANVTNVNVTRHPELLAVVLQSLSSLIAAHSITWRESVETVCLFGFTQQLLKDTNMSTKLSVLALKLVQVTVDKFMPPNLALLMDTLQGSSIDQLGPMIRRKLGDDDWEVRDSALEVLTVVAHIARNKFPAFQGHMIENGLCLAALTLASDDGEAYVRASALKCLAQMVRVRAFWDACLTAHQLPLIVMTILREESEGIVRREAATLMKEIHQHNHIPKSLLPDVYETMSRAVVSDLYWEVEVNALGFWEGVIEHGLRDQGMIDGVFPKVTFSKETRKIVTLTPEEIVARLGKVLKELEQLGCLQVLLTALEDCDLKVVDKSARILSRLARTMSQYGVIPPTDAALLPLDPSSPLQQFSDGHDQTVPSSDALANLAQRLETESQPSGAGITETDGGFKVARESDGSFKVTGGDSTVVQESDTGFKVTRELDGSFKVARESDGGFKVARESDGSFKVARESDEGFKVARESDGSFKVARESERGFNVTRESDGSFKVARESDGGFKVTRESDGSFKVARESDEGFKVARESDGNFKVARESEGGFKVAREPDGGFRVADSRGSDAMMNNEWLIHRVDKRKLNPAGSSEWEELGFTPLTDNNTGATLGSTQKLPKIFKMDNLGESQLNMTRNNLRDKYELGCVPISFQALGDSPVKVPNTLVASTPAPRYQDELFPADLIRPELPPRGLSPKVNNASANHATSRGDAVIEDIVQSTDMNLLVSVFSRQMSLVERTVAPARPEVGSEEFLSRLAGFRLQEMLDERSRWLKDCGDDLGSLLDDILAGNKNMECSALDCY